jgi:hypothetical protein
MQGPNLKNKRIIFAGTADEVQGHVQALASRPSLDLRENGLFSCGLGETRLSRTLQRGLTNVGTSIDTTSPDNH